MLDEKKMLAIQLLIDGNLSKTDIAKKCDKSRTWLYDCLNLDEFNVELNRRIQDIKTLGEKEFNAKLGMAIDEYWNLIQTTQDSRTKEKALSYWIDRSLGKLTSRIEMEVEAKQNIDERDLLEDINEVEYEVMDDSNTLNDSSFRV